MHRENDLIGWISRAEEDYQLALISLRRKSPLTYGVTFHAQQCVEKYIKALLTMQKIAFPRTHDLAALFALCQKNGLLIPVSEDSLDKLSAFAVEARYPGAQPTIDEAREAYQTARNVRRFARRFLGFKN